MPSHNAFSFDLEGLIFFCCYVIKHLSPKHILISTQTEYVLLSNEPKTISLLRGQSDIDNTTIKALKDVFFGLPQLKIFYSQMIGHVFIYLIEMHGILYISWTLDDIKILVDGIDLRHPDIRLNQWNMHNTQCASFKIPNILIPIQIINHC